MITRSQRPELTPALAAISISRGITRYCFACIRRRRRPGTSIGMRIGRWGEGRQVSGSVTMLSAKLEGAAQVESGRVEGTREETDSVRTGYRRRTVGTPQLQHLGVASDAKGSERHDSGRREKVSAEMCLIPRRAGTAHKGSATKSSVA